MPSLCTDKRQLPQVPVDTKHPIQQKGGIIRANIPEFMQERRGF